MSFAYRCALMGHQVQQPDRSWPEKLNQLGKLDLGQWMKFVPAHLVADAGHRYDEPGILPLLLQATDEYAELDFVAADAGKFAGKG